jgi:branched-chain amino acid transport system permease protein
VSIHIYLSLTLVQLFLLNSLMAYSAFLGMVSGAFSIAYVAFIGLGAYTTAILATDHGVPLVLNLVLAPLLCAAVALALVRPLERLSGIYLAIASVGMVALFQIVLFNFADITHGAEGIPGIPLDVKTWTLIVAVVVVALVLRQVQRSEVGRAIRMTRLDPIVAVSLGVNVRRLRVWLFVASAAAGGVAGVMRAHYFGFVSPEVYGFELVVILLAMVVVGGVGHWLGPLVGAAIFTLLPEWLQSLAEWRDVVIGGLLLLIIIITREGLTGAVQYGWYRLHRRYDIRRLAAAEPAVAPLAWSADDPQTPLEPETQAK